MTNPWNQPAYEDDDNFDDPNDGAGKKPNPLREHLRKLEKENKELKETNEKALRQLRSTGMETILEAKGISVKVAKLIPADVEPTAEAVGKWLEEYAEVFGLTDGATGGKSDDGDGSNGEPDPEDQARQDAMGRIAKATNAATTPNKQADMLAAIANAKNREELLALVEQHGGGIGSG